ncbi:E3 ubiquitin-protein ligase XB3 [Hordeum vulgare]|nr:E3 ubiquitin-protein ligase XB3 [Hordeum vulgare]
MITYRWLNGRSGSSRAGSSQSHRPENIIFPITGPVDYESHREWASRCGKERIRIAEAHIMEEMTVTEAADTAARTAAEGEAIHARILRKRQQTEMCALAREQNLTVCEMVRLPSKVEKDVSDGEGSCGDEHIRLDPYRVFDRYLREKDDKGFGRGKDIRG